MNYYTANTRDPAGGFKQKRRNNFIFLIEYEVLHKPKKGGRGSLSEI